MFSSSFRQGITTETSGVGRLGRGGGCLLECAHGGSGRSNACAPRGSAAVARASVDDVWDAAARVRDLPRLRLPVPPHRRRRRALVPQPRRAARRRGPRGHLPDAAPVGARRGAARSPACGSSRSGRGWRSTCDGPAADRAAARFGAGVLRAPAAPRAPLRRRAHRVVPVLLAARRGAACGRSARYALVVDWHEVWTARLLARVPRAAPAWLGIAVQRRCARVRQRAFCFSRLHAARLREEGLRGEVTVLEGEYAGRSSRRSRSRPSRSCVFAGRLIPEKRAPSVVAARSRSPRERIPGLRGVIFGDGPERDGACTAAIAALGGPGSSSAPGFVDAAEVARRAARAPAACCCPRAARATA